MNITEDFFNLVIDFGDDWRIINVETDHQKLQVYLDIEYIGKEYKDPDTLEIVKLYDHSEIRIWRHLDILQYQSYVRCRIPRVLCKNGKVKQIAMSWAGKYDRHTYRFENRVIDLLKATKNQTKTAEFINCSFRLVNKIIHRSTKRGMERRNLSDLSFKHLSIDEKSFKKGHKYVSVLSHPRSGCIIDIEEGRTKESVKMLIDKTLTIEQQSGVTTISMDMWQAYLSVAKEKLPNADIVHDRFHLVQYLNKAIDSVRRREVKSNHELKNSRYALLKNQINLTEKQRIKFEAIAKANYEVSKAWEVKENFKDMFNQETEKVNGFELFYKWVSNSINKKIKEVNKVVTMFENHLSGVINALITNFNNSMAERLNGKIQEVKLVGRGYRTFKKFRSAILFFHGGLDLYPLNW